MAPDLTILDATDAYLQALLLKREAIVNQYIMDTFPDNSNLSNEKAKEDLDLSLDHVLRHKKPHTMPMLRYDIPLAAERGDGFEERFWSTTHTPVLTDDGEVAYILQETRDITNQVQQELNNLYRKEHLTQLTSATNAVVWVYDEVKDQLLWGGSAYTVFGYTPEQMGTVLDAWAKRVHPEDLPAVMESLKKPKEAGSLKWAAEYRFLKADGTYTTVLDQSYTMLGSDHKPFRTIGSMIDTSMGKHAQEALRESNERFQQLIEALPLMAWTASPSGKILHFNRNWYSYTGMPQGQTEGWINVVHPEDSAQVLTAWRKAIVTGQLLEEEYRIRDYIDGSYRWFLERAVPIQDENGKVKLWIGTYTDIHEQKHVLEQLRVKDQFMENILKTSPAHLCLLSGPKHICQFVTPGVYHMYGSRQYIGRPASAIWPELDVFDFGKLLDQVYHEGVTVSINEFRTPIDRYQRGEPQDAYFNFKYQPLLGGDGNVEGVLISAIEVTEFVSAKNKAEALAMELQTR
jgi:PAS domain S-box-containing protein